MAKFGKRIIISARDYTGTGIFSRLNFSGKFYLALGLLMGGLLVQFFLFLNYFYEYRGAMTELTQTRNEIDESLRDLRNEAVIFLGKANASISSGNPVNVASDFNQLSQKLNIIKNDLDVNSLTESIGATEKAINQLKEDILLVTVGEERRLSKTYGQYLDAINDLENEAAGYFQQKRQSIFLLLMGKLSLVFLFMVLTLMLSRTVIKSAFSSINEPAELLVKSLKGANGDLQKKLPILASEGLGATGLIINDGIAKWRTLALELKNASNKLNYLMDELSAGFNQVFLYEVQVQEVYREIMDNFTGQNQMAVKVNEQIAALISDLTGLQTIPRKISQISEEMNSLITVTNEHMSGVLNKPVEVTADSQSIIKFLTELSNTSERVDRIMKELGEIEEESEMLAFNSAISAARAGQEGQGFSIVAKEIANLVDRSKKASTVLSELIGQVQQKTEQIVDFIPDKDAIKQNESPLAQTIATICSNLNETATTCVNEIDQMRQVIEMVITRSSETFAEIDSVSDLPQVDVSELDGIKQAMDRYLESIKHTGEIAGKIFETVNNLQSATDLLSYPNARQ